MKLNFISDIKKSHKSCRKYDGVKRYIETGNVQETKIVGFEEYTYDKKPSRANLCVSAGTVLVAKMQNSIKVLLIDKETENYIYSTGFYAFKDERILPTFLKYFFLSSYFNHKKDIKCTGGTQKAINDEGMKQICISVPSFEEQEKITNKLELIKEAIECGEKRIQLYDELVKSKFVEMFGYPEDNNFGWHEVNVEDIAEIQVGVVIKPAQYYTNAENGIPAFRSLNVGNMSVNDKDWVYFTKEGQKINKKSILHKNDLVVVRSGAPGTTCVITEEYDGYNAIDVIIAHPNLNVINPFYLALYTNMPHGKLQIEGGTGGAAQQHFNVSKYKKLKLLLPPLNIQNNFIDFFNKIVNIKNIEKKKIMFLLEYQQTELHNYFD